MKTNSELKLDFIKTLLNRTDTRLLTLENVYDYWVDEIRYDYCITWDEWLDMVIDIVNDYNYKLSELRKLNEVEK